MGLSDDSKSLVRTLEVKKSLDDLSSLLTEFSNAPSAVLTGRIRESAEKIRTLTADNPRQQGRLDVLEPLIAAMIKNASRESIDEVRRNIGMLRDEEDRWVAERSEHSAKTAAVTIAVIQAGAAAALLAVLVFALITRAGLRERRGHREELDRFFNLSRDLFCIRGFDGKFKLVNSAWERTLGYTKEELLGKPFTEIVHPDDIESTVASVKDLTRGKDTIAFDNRYRTKDGVYRWLRWNATAVNAEGRIYAAARDITERREAERSRARHAEEVALVSQMMDVLQSCETPAEAHQVIDHMAPKLFPGFSGAAYQLAASRNVLERIATWGTRGPSENFISPADCLALKRGRTAVADPGSALHCQHVGGFKACYVCVPMVALNDTIGMLHLRQEAEAAPIQDMLVTFAVSIAEQVAMTLANLRLRETLRAQSIRDPLTGLFNRRYLEESFEREIHRASRKGTALSVLMLDLDYFKRFNDTFGHDAGDTVLHEWGGFLQARVRFEDIACRLGGEEFAIVLPDASLESARQIAERICEDARGFTVSHRNKPVGSITVSIGIASFPTHGASTEMLLHAADQALYQAKSAGRNQAVIAAGQPA